MKLTLAKILLCFALLLCMDQLRRGRRFLWEHPAGADSWTQKKAVELLSREEVDLINSDQCRFNLRSPMPENKLMKKGTYFARGGRFDDNRGPSALDRRLSKKCSWEHRDREEHVSIEGTVQGKPRSRAAQIWPTTLVSEVVSGSFENWARTKDLPIYEDESIYAIFGASVMAKLDRWYPSGGELSRRGAGHR